VYTSCAVTNRSFSVLTSVSHILFLGFDSLTNCFEMQQLTRVGDNFRINKLIEEFSLHFSLEVSSSCIVDQPWFAVWWVCIISSRFTVISTCIFRTHQLGCPLQCSSVSAAMFPMCQSDAHSDLPLPVVLLPLPSSCPLSAAEFSELPLPRSGTHCQSLSSQHHPTTRSGVTGTNWKLLCSSDPSAVITLVDPVLII